MVVFLISNNCFLCIIWENRSVQFRSVAQSCPTLRPPESQHARPPLSITNSRSSLKLTPEGATEQWLISSPRTRIIFGEGDGTPLQYSCLENPMDRGAWWAAVQRVTRSWTRLSVFTFTFHFHALEKEMATHSSVLTWRMPGMREPGGLPFMGSHRVGYDWSDLAVAGPASY